MKGLRLTIKFTEEELNAIVDAVEKIDGWVHVKPLESAVGKIVDELNGLGAEVTAAINDALSKEENGTAVYHTDDEANEIMRKRIERIKTGRK